MRSEHHIEHIGHIECKINWERTFIKVEPFIEKTVPFWDSIKKLKRSHQRQVHSQKFFWTGEDLGNKGTSINISLKA